MAEQKQTFVFRKEWKEAIQDLPADIRLEIYECIIEYATSGKLPALKSMAKVAFGFIKNTIDRDQSKYQEAISQKSESGRFGNLKRWHPDLYDEVQKENLSLEEAENIAKHRKVSQRDKFIANVAVSVSDSVSVSVSDSDYYGAVADAIKSNQRIIELAAMQSKIEKQDVNDLIPDFVAQKSAVKEKWRDETEIFKNFLYWVPKRLAVQNSVKSQNQQNGKIQNTRIR